MQDMSGGGVLVAAPRITAVGPALSAGQVDAHYAAGDRANGHLGGLREVARQEVRGILCMEATAQLLARELCGVVDTGALHEAMIRLSRRIK